MRVAINNEGDQRNNYQPRQWRSPSCHYISLPAGAVMTAHHPSFEFRMDNTACAVIDRAYSGLKYAGRPRLVSRRMPTIAARTSGVSLEYFFELSFPERTAQSFA